MPVLEVEGLGHRYYSPSGSIEVFSNINFTVDAGQILVVRGDSGSGKTTLLLACGAMQQPKSGRVLVQGRELFKQSSAYRSRLRAQSVGYLFQTLELIPYLNLIENVRLSGGTSIEAARKWLGRLGLAERASFKPERLSHGQRQRAALARAIAHGPQLVIADEPTGNLDEKNSTLVFEMLRSYADEGHAVVIATHERRAEQFADNILCIDNGAAVAEGPR